MSNLLLRRSFLTGLMIGGTAVALDQVTRSWITGDSALSSGSPVPRLDGELRRARLEPLQDLGLDGEIRDDGASIERAANDYGRMVHHEPLAVLMPGSIEDIEKMVRYAREHHLAIGVRGAGNSALGQAQSTGILIDMSSLATVHEVRDNAIVADAGVTWLNVVKHGMHAGAASPTVPVNLSHTVGGLLAVGGLSAAMHKHGLAADNVESIDVVTAEGERRTCSRTLNRDLFEATLAGFGHGGATPTSIIVRATMKLTRLFSDVRTYTVLYEDVHDFVRAMRESAAAQRFDELSGKIVTTPAQGWAYMLEGVVFFDRHEPPNDEFRLTNARAGSLDASIQDKDYHSWIIRGLGKLEHLHRAALWDKQHPVLKLLLPDECVCTFLQEMLPSISQDELGCLPIRLTPVVASKIQRSAFPAPRGDISFALSLERFPQNGEEDLARIIDHDQALFDKARRMGASPFGAGSIDLSGMDTTGKAVASWANQLTDRHNGRGILLDV